MEKAIDVKRALISVHDKTGVGELAQFLHGLGVQILSTGGTSALIKKHGVPVVDVSDYTQFPEMLSGRVKTLHPKVHGGILYRRNLSEDVAAIEKHGIFGIDLVVVNLYPFEQTVAKKGVSLEEAIENIDIGGPTLLRSSAKNYFHVAVVSDPADYASIQEELTQLNGRVSFETRQKLIRKAFEHTASYDAAISAHFQNLSGNAFPFLASRTLRKVADLRYGENPHQSGALYAWKPGLAEAKQLLGKAMSYNNWLDAYSAYRIAREFDDTVAVVMKHNNPCGGAQGESQADALKKALQTDPVSAFGGVYAFNKPVTAETADVLSEWFVEVIVANGFEADALPILSKKQNRRLLDASAVWNTPLPSEIRSIGGSVLVQDADALLYKEITQASVRAPTVEEKADLDFAWRFCKHAKSNAIVFAKNRQVVGVGAGQMSRVDAVKLAKMKA
ncbi:MAG: bifunctional phosphoribosylaminoimidazolecarboxamide formyltransferase/IMP cyclohydrolase, partial [Candidatus Micrarchaeota archaeon]|nr:bifunctional phosphoribosylaminoimidazolecarboxamide formyltransferase/IMP cyclohydrolase [Candidatus Micrarchaeota archaeon]